MPSAPASQPGTFRRLGAVGPVAIVLSFWPPLGGFLLLATLTSFAPWLRGHYNQALLLYFLIASVLVGVSFLPTFAVAIYAGWVFGFGVGFCICMAALTLAAVIAYAIGRWIARDRVMEVVAEKPAWQAVHRALLGDAQRIVFVTTLLRIPPMSPFAIVNFVLAAARVPLGSYMLGTIIGLTPRTLAAAYVAAGIQELTTKDLDAKPAWMTIAGGIAMVVMCFVIGAMANRALRSMAQTRAS